jgi:hypothetical protein
MAKTYMVTWMNLIAKNCFGGHGYISREAYMLTKLNGPTTSFHKAWIYQCSIANCMSWIQYYVECPSVDDQI